MDAKPANLQRPGWSDLFLGLLALAALAVTYSADPGLMLFIGMGSLIWFAVVTGHARRPVQFGLASLFRLTAAVAVLAALGTVAPPQLMYLIITYGAFHFLMKHTTPAHTNRRVSLNRASDFWYRS